jgi:hypothetical protein
MFNTDMKDSIKSHVKRTTLTRPEPKAAKIRSTLVLMHITQTANTIVHFYLCKSQQFMLAQRPAVRIKDSQGYRVRNTRSCFLLQCFYLP